MSISAGKSIFLRKDFKAFMLSAYLTDDFWTYATISQIEFMKKEKKIGDIRMQILTKATSAGFFGVKLP